MAEPLKNLFSPALIAHMAQHLSRAGEFDAGAFQNMALTGLETLEFKARSNQIADALEAALPADFSEACTLLRLSLHPGAVPDNWQDAPDDGGIRGWAILPMAEFVARRGLDDFDLSLATLRELTSRSTSEFAVRAFLINDFDRALAVMRTWVDDPDPHVRRLVSEGTRPRLPWGAHLKAVIADPSPVLPILKALRDDDSDYVRRSVANSLNDIAKDHPDLVAGLTRDWLQNAPPARQKLLRHACRTLIKQGHKAALAAFGFTADHLPAVKLTISGDRFAMGDQMVMTLALTNGPTAQKLMVDYILLYRRANGTLGPKVFKWAQVSLAPGEVTHLSKAHVFREISTRKHYTGPHEVRVQINGEQVARAQFHLEVKAN